MFSALMSTGRYEEWTGLCMDHLALFTNGNCGGQAPSVSLWHDRYRRPNSTPRTSPFPPPTSPSTRRQRTWTNRWAGSTIRSDKSSESCTQRATSLEKEGFYGVGRGLWLLHQKFNNNLSKRWIWDCFLKPSATNVKKLEINNNADIQNNLNFASFR